MGEQMMLPEEMGYLLCVEQNIKKILSTWNRLLSYVLVARKDVKK